ncbi:MAG: AAA family ATPase [Alphaproteobacteria bacterium]|nr:AAA family ATPase [Alphaproteobacteria bacterium]
MADADSPTDSAYRVPVDELYRPCDPTGLADALRIAGARLLGVGHERAREAIALGLSMSQPGCNIFALGPPGVGKQSLVTSVLDAEASRRPPPSDWVYVQDFADDVRRPRAICLPAGRGAQLRRDMEALIEELISAIPAVFESEDYRARRQMIEDKFKNLQEDTLAAVEKEARSRGVAIIRLPMGMALAPIANGEVIAPDDFNRLPEAEQARFRTEMSAVQEKLQATLRKVPQWESEHRQAVRDINREVVRFAISHMMTELRDRYADIKPIAEHLAKVEADLVDNAERLLSADQGPPELMGEAASAQSTKRAAFRRYQVNLLVDHSGAASAPVVWEDHPTLANLIGRIEYRSQFGSLTTDFTLIKPGALHRANGGYLVLDARRVLTQPMAWEELTRTLRAKQIRIQSIAEVSGFLPPISLEPEPVPLDVKIVLLGDRRLYYLLAALDPDFPELFKIAADFDDSMPRTPEAERALASALGSIAAEGKGPRLGAGAAARLVEHAARMAENSERLACAFETLSDIVYEAATYAGQSGADALDAAHVEAALGARQRRAGRVPERIREEMLRRSLLIDVAGTRIGQMNGLTVAQLGTEAFGWPTRITARIRLGGGKVLDIEREVEMGGPIHSKGVMILSGFLGGRFASDGPLALNASLVFEQSYGGVEGDSASMAELLALLSAIAEVPLRQDIAMTGSVNQHGDMQPIGGVNEKIEGFFDLCQAAGLSGTQGVIIPKANLRNLMLRADARAAVSDGRFHIYAASTADEAAALMTGLPAGARGADGAWTEGSLNSRVAARLAALAERARKLSHGSRQDNVS